MLFFLSDNIYSSSSWRPTSDVLDVVQQTFSILSPALPAQLNAGTWLDLTDTMKDVSKGSLSLSDVMRGRVLDRCLKNMWDFTRVHIKHGNLVPLPSYFYITFTHPVITRRIRGGSTAAYVKSRCIGALVVNKIAADINSRTVPVSDVELASLSSILDSDSRDVRLCLTQPGFVELVNIASIPLHPNTFLNAKDVPLDARDVFQETLDILSQALPAEENAELQSDQTIALSNISDDRFERTIVSRLHGALKTCILSTSSLAEEVRTSYLRLSLKALWHSAKAYHRTNNPLPPYFPLILASPEITQHFQTERDPVARLTGCCFGALIVSNLVDALKSPISLSDHVDNAKLACILAILGKEHHRNLLSFHQLWVINLWNVISLMSSEIDILFTTEGTPADMLDISQDTLYILVNRLHNRSFGFEDVPTDQRELLLDLPAEVLKIRVEVLDAVDSDLDRLKDQTMKILDRLRQVLEKI
ncbi:hypothetical protein BJY52DRAFT_1270819 [Lactarius psammicola]|nr:hypothetical protein BJY52DRAFT_1270819 [Lactarius psammicola]